MAARRSCLACVRAVAGALALGGTLACATSRAPASLPPHRLTVTSPIEHARLLVRAAMDSARISVDGNPPANADLIVGSFVVRRGGMGEAEVQVRLRLTRDAELADTAGVLLEIDATARDRHRAIAMMTPEEARSPRMSNAPHPIQANDRESLQRIARLLDRLQRFGFTVLDRTRPPS